ncbi:MAG TPA: hypothetical protein VGV93_07575 [Acidimicrobiales bacterium]|nr:hypothetical protein [Acidimicrobiales bacterium]
MVGYSVVAGGSSKPIWFGGGKLAKDLTLPALRAGWRSIDDQGAAWRADAGAGGRERWSSAPKRGDDGAKRARAVTDRLAKVPIEDGAAWANAARDGAGVLAALSRRFERDRPGALAAAADILARSAQKADHRQPRRTDMAGLATVAAQAALVYRGAQAGSAGWLLVAAELRRLAQAVERAHTARDELARARELHRRSEAVVAMIGHEVDKKSGPRRRRRRRLPGGTVRTEETSVASTKEASWTDGDPMKAAARSRLVDVAARYVFVRRLADGNRD